MNRLKLLWILVLVTSAPVLAQVPVISNISVKNLYPKGVLIITGSGFSNTSTDLRVVFGHVEGKILSSSEFSIEVEVPAAAKFSNVEVINTLSRRMAKSNFKFLPSFYGNGFSVSNFSSSTSFSSTQELRDICSCDLNSDGMPDLVMTKFSAASDIMVMKNTTNPATPNLVSFSREIHALGFSSDHVSCGDVDGDGRPDLVITKGGSSNRNAVFLMRNISTTSSILFSSPYSLSLETNHVAIQANIRDLNKDGRPEIIVTNTTNNIIYIFPNDPSKPLGSNPYPTSATEAIKIAVTGLSNTYGLDVQDFDNDGLPDIMVNPISSSDHYVLRNTTSNAITFAAPQKIPLVGELRNVTSADLNNDGYLDLISTSTNTNKAFVLISASSSGNISFPYAPITLTTDSGPWGVSVSDIDGDTDADVIVSHQLTATVNVFLNDGASAPTFTKHSIPTSRPARNLVTGDLNADGKPDIAVATYVVGTYSVDILRNTICHKPKMLNEAPAFICNNPIILRTIPALNVTYEWRKDNAVIKTGADNFASVNAGGSYTVSASTISPAGECVNVISESFTVNGSAGSVPENPVLTVNTPVCSGGQINLSTTAASGASYKWTGPAGWTTTTGTATTSIPNVTAANGGEYTVQIIVGNCKSNVSAAKVVDVVAVDDFKITSNSATNSACAPGGVKLTVTSLSGFSYAWKRDSEPYGAPSAVNTYDAIQDGQYYVKASNATLGCPDREIGPVRVAILSVPVANFTIGDPKCANVPIQFTNTSTVDADGEGSNPVAPVQFKWAFGDGKTSIDRNPLNTFTAGGITYNVSLTVSYTGVSGCTNSKVSSLPITNTTLPVLTADPATICPGEPTTITVTPSYSNITWEHGGSGQTTTVTQPGTYTASATDASGCIVPKSITIESKETPELTVTATPQVIPGGQTSQLNASGAHTFVWSPAETLSNASVADPIASPAGTTTYTVTGSFLGGCSAQAQITVTVDGSLININPPVAFSPNGDGPNDTWIIEGIEAYSDCTMNIFDGRGRRIYQKTGYNNDWDGTYEGKPVPSGTYYYVFGCPNAQPVTGSVLVFR